MLKENMGEFFFYSNFFQLIILGLQKHLQHHSKKLIPPRRFGAVQNSFSFLIFPYVVILELQFNPRVLKYKCKWPNIVVTKFRGFNFDRKKGTAYPTFSWFCPTKNFLIGH